MERRCPRVLCGDELLIHPDGRSLTCMGCGFKIRIVSRDRIGESTEGIRGSGRTALRFVLTVAIGTLIWMIADIAPEPASYHCPAYGIPDAAINRFGEVE